MTCHITAEDLMHAGLTKSNSGAQIFDFPKFSHRLSITMLRTVGATVNNARAFTLSGCTVHVNHCKCSSILLSIADFQAIRAALNPLHNTLCCTDNSTTALEYKLVVLLASENHTAQARKVERMYRMPNRNSTIAEKFPIHLHL